ncbi:MAG: rane protein insertase YidC [Crocinitomicaceae bacterium]|jgi:YidC/Oxa1 family membrane protein insertase|nr:rane protein insertase YidC [Crocinitomicaceae bacterium]
MDRNTIIGLGVIGAILVTFTILNKPSEEELKKQRELEKKEKKEQALEKQKEKEAEKTAVVKKADDKSTKDTTSSVAKEVKAAAPAETIRLESDKLIVEISTKGGNVEAAYIKGYQSYFDFRSKNKKEKALQLFSAKDASNELEFEANGKTYKTGNEMFEVVKKTKRSVTLAWTPEDGKTLKYTYKLLPGKYDLDYKISQKGLDAKNASFIWNVDMKQTERLLSEQKRVSTICYKYKGEDFSYLSEMADDELQYEKPVEWIAYKQSYFSTIIQPDVAFSNKKAESKIRNFKKGDDKFFSHIKRYRSKLGVDLSGSEASAGMSWYFGPNDYEMLKSYKSDYEDIINYGWGLFRWINIYAIQPIFNVLASTGMGLGLVVLLLTLVIKLFLTPIQWKMYVSSAKMRILKPEIDDLNKKYPNKEDAMKKQMEMMTLYRESGASPLAGCIPMLIQMPILLAVFRFFPASFELRQKPFLWAEDLSSYDSVYDFGFYVPLYGDHISLFTLLMAVTTLAYTWLNSGQMQQQQQPGMPNMKVLMYIFPFMMIFFFNNYSSGLSYYYFISTLISILIMLAIKYFFVDEEKLRAKMAAKKANAANGAGKKKSKFQERLEQAQKAQQEKRGKR